MKAGDSWQEWEYKILRENYGKITNKELNKLLPHRGIHTLRKRANILGLKGSMSLHSFKYSVDYNFFDKPTIENCYWAGYIAADGCLMGRRDDALRLCCISSDKAILENFKQITKATQCIKDHEGKQLVQNNKVYNCSPTSHLEIWGVNRWHKNLQKYWNITPKKSLTLKHPNITNKKQTIAFICGYIDGDGACYFSNTKTNKGFILTISGTKNLLKWINKFITQNSPIIKHGRLRLNGKSKVNYSLAWNGKNAIKIHNFLKESINLQFKLPRKWDIDYD